MVVKVVVVVVVVAAVVVDIVAGAGVEVKTLILALESR